MRAVPLIVPPDDKKQKGQSEDWPKCLILLARPERFERPTPWFVAKYSIQLSYGRIAVLKCAIVQSLCISLKSYVVQNSAIESGRIRRQRIEVLRQPLRPGDRSSV